MTEQIITFETAKLAKEKGFKIPTLHFFFEDGVLMENELRDTVGMDYGSDYIVEASQLLENWNDGWKTAKNGDRCYGCSSSKYLTIFSAPTQSLLQKWLREIHNRHITIFKIVGNPDTKDEIVCWTWKTDTPWENWSTYEEALEAALIHALNLIP